MTAIPLAPAFVPEQIHQEKGHAFLVFLDGAENGDDQADTRRSNLQVLEDGRPLGPAHAIHDDIRRSGRGRFSHWNNRLYFSTSDNSDPRTNGRRYQISAMDTALVMPEVLHVALTTACNLTCRTCRNDNLNSQSLDDSIIDRLIDEVFPTLSELRLDVAGEPTLHKAKFRRILEGAGKHGVSVFMCTNAMLIDEELARFICDNPAMAKIQLSLDSTDPELLEWIRRGATLDGITTAIRYLVSARAATGRQNLSFNIHAALLSNNIDELPGFIRYCHREGVETLSTMFGFIQQFMDPDLSVFWDKERHNRSVDEAASLAKELGIDFNNWGRFDLGPLPGAAAKRTPCHYLNSWSVVYSGGHVAPCCLSTSFELGHLDRDSFGDIWRGEAYEALRRTHNTDNPTNPKCAACYNRLGWDAGSYRPYFHPDHWPLVRRRLGLGDDE